MELLLYFMLAMFPFIIGENMWDYSDLPKTIWIRCGVILLAAIFFWNATKIKHSRSLISFAVFLTWAAVSLGWSINTYEGIVILSKWITLGVLFFIILNMDFIKTTLFEVIFYSAWLVSLIGLSQHFFDTSWFWQGEEPGTTFRNCNVAGRYLVLALPLGIVLINKTPFKQVKMAVGSMMLCMVVFVVAAKFRAGMVAIVAVSVLASFMYGKTRIRAAAVLLSVLFVIVAISFNPSFFKPGGKYVRTINTIEIATSHPIKGIGVGQFEVYYDQYSPIHMNTKDAHNDYLQIFAELGMIGLLLFSVFIWFAWYDNRDKHDIQSRVLKMGLVGFLIMAFFSFPFEKTGAVVLAITYLGALECEGACQSC